MRISQIVTSSEIKYSKRVRAFTEQGVAMLSSVLKSHRAIEVNIAIMRAFVHLRKMIASHKELAKKLKELEHHIKDHDEKIRAIFEAIQQLISLPPGDSKKKIGFTAKEVQKWKGRQMVMPENLYNVNNIFPCMGLYDDTGQPKPDITDIWLDALP